MREAGSEMRAEVELMIGRKQLSHVLISIYIACPMRQ